MEDSQQQPARQSAGVRSRWMDVCTLSHVYSVVEGLVGSRSAKLTAQHKVREAKLNPC